jgi:CheY-like chemotaxis protein
VIVIVKNHGGFVTVQSKPAKGSRFKVYLPVVDELQAEPGEGAATAPPGRGELVMLVDDEALVREATQRVLKANGYRVITAANGEEALRLFMRNRDDIQLVLTDMMMPVMDGVRLIRSLRTLEPSVKILATSGLEEAFSREELGALGLHEILAKPCEPVRLLRALRRALTATRSTALPKDEPLIAACGTRRSSQPDPAPIIRSA